VTRDALSKTTKDLRVAGYLVEALVNRYGFAGLRDGLQLLRGLLEQCWDRVFPAIEDNDVEVRAGLFNSFDDMNTQRRAPLPQTLRMLPIIGAGTRKHSFQDWLDSQNPKHPQNAELADSVPRAIQATPPEHGTELVQVLGECAQEIDNLAKALEVRLGP